MARSRREPGKFSGKQEQVALLLASGHALKHAAEKSGAGRTTVYAWTRQPDFAAHVAELRSQMLDEALGVLSRIAGKAALTIAKKLDSDDDAIALRASVAALDQLVKVRSFSELESRIAEIEKNAAQAAEGGRRWGA